MILNRRVERGHFCLVLNPKRKVFSLHPTFYFEKFQKYRKVQRIVQLIPVYTPVRFNKC